MTKVGTYDEDNVKAAEAAAGAECSDGVDTTEALQFEDALDLVGCGRYQYALVAWSGAALLAQGAELFGFSVVVTAATCDLRLSLQHQAFLNSMPFIAVILASYAWGYLADTRGRRRVLLYSMSVSWALSTLSCLSPNWIVLAVIKFISICFSCATNAATYTLLGECSAACARARYMLIATVPLMFAQSFSAALAYPVLRLRFELALPALGMTLRPWRLLAAALAVPCGVCALTLRHLHESPKYLASRGRASDAMRVLRSMYHTNKGRSAAEFKVTSLVLEETAATTTSGSKRSLLRGVWEQTAPLFRPPLLANTLRLYFILFIVYATNTGFVIWLPRLLTSLFVTLERGDTASISLCALISSSATTLAPNRSLESPPAVCVDGIADSTILSIVVHGAGMTALSVAVAMAGGGRQRAVLAGSLAVSAAAALAATFTPEPFSGLFFLFLFTSTALCMGVLSSYFVQLYPTAYRGMVACLGVVVGRLSGFLAINLVGGVIYSHCRLTFLAWAVLVLAGVAATYFLPPPERTAAGAAKGAVPGAAAAPGADRAEPDTVCTKL